MDRRVTHGGCPRGRQPKKYTVWCNLKRRILRSNHPAYADYGGRGITFCERWQDYAAFSADVPDPPSADSTLDRIDNSRGYEPGNVRWASRTDQQNNTRRNIRIEYHGRTQTLAQWCRELSLPYNTTRVRIKAYGWTVERAFSGSRC